MVREGRIKDYNWTIPASAATTSTTYSDHVLNGTLAEIDFSLNRVGSISVFVSGTSEILFNTGAVSGTSTQVVRPVVLQKYNDNTFAIGSITQSAVFNAPVGLTVTALASGTNPLYVNLRYI